MAGDDSEPEPTAAAPARSVAPGSAGLARVEIADPAGLLAPAALRRLGDQATRAVAHTGRGGEVRVRLVADPEMTAAHERYARVPGTTDVLTFDLSEGHSARGGPLDADLLACVDEARRQADAHGHAPERELLLYILHGVLHCLGHDDHDDDAFARMHAEEDRILEAIGVGATFAPPAAGGAAPGGAGEGGR